MKQNLGKVDRVLRFALAFWWLGPFALTFSVEWANWVVLFIGAVSLLESFTGYCWLHDAFGIHNKNQ